MAECCGSVVSVVSACCVTSLFTSLVVWFCFVWLCLVWGLSHLCLVFCLFLVGSLCFSLGLVVTCAGCVHNYVAVMLLRVGWSCEGMLRV